MDTRSLYHLLTNISFVLGVKEEPVLHWLERATQKAVAINTALLKELPVTEVQSPRKEGESGLLAVR